MAEHSIVFKNEISEISRLHDYLVEVGEDAKIDEFLLESLNLAVEEAVVNVINYAYPEGEEGEVKIAASDDGKSVTFTISDQGKPFDPTQAKEADITLSAEDREIGGLGIHLIRSIMDEVKYQRTPDGKNVLTLTKFFDNN